MDSTYVGKYGDLKAASLRFMSSDKVKELMGKSSDEILSALSQTDYREDLDKFVKMYKIPDSVEIAINAHMVGMLRHVYEAVPPLARDFIYAYMSKWDIENIKVILSSKFLGYEVGHSEAFLVIQHDLPVSLVSGIISGADYRTIIEQKGVEEVVSSLVRFGYGALLLKHIESFRRKGSISDMLLALDRSYYSDLMSSFRFYNGDEGAVLEFVRELIDMNNILSVIKAMSSGYSDMAKDFIIPGGNIRDEIIYRMLSKPDIESIKQDLPFEIGWAFDRYKRDRSIGVFEYAIMDSIYSKYLGIFSASSGALSFILWFILRCEIERDTLRSIWFNKYYGIDEEKPTGAIMARYFR
ncbi:MAG: V-type ATPase subunit [Candidatus Marsarchaeota archaeon]|nr:V-type ATPase subunit [Candidatus Marsarchaeota archaeon]